MSSAMVAEIEAASGLVAPPSLPPFMAVTALESLSSSPPPDKRAAPIAPKAPTASTGTGNPNDDDDSDGSLEPCDAPRYLSFAAIFASSCLCFCSSYLACCSALFLFMLSLSSRSFCSFFSLMASCSLIFCSSFSCCLSFDSRISSCKANRRSSSAFRRSAAAASTRSLLARFSSSSCSTALLSLKDTLKSLAFICRNSFSFSFPSSMVAR
mmetsp:Transcript_5814/g.11978  ORF Transcript_5814/g.11978 Transcript_5814/m.11978 type:complete len:211 (-) Transcript_5814:657-1289(-)